MNSQEFEKKFIQETGETIYDTFQEYAGGPIVESGYSEEYVKWLQKQIIILSNNGVLDINMFQPEIGEKVWVHVKDSNTQCLVEYIGCNQGLNHKYELVEFTHWVIDGAEKMKQSFLAC
jgi:hypothetical protein